jgi:hypothetical protein
MEQVALRGQMLAVTPKVGVCDLLRLRAANPADDEISNPMMRFVERILSSGLQHLSSDSRRGGVKTLVIFL